ncbi:hypothetical protein AB7W12_09250 [Providencia rettgeri]
MRSSCPLTVIFSTPGDFCLLIAAHRLFDAEQQKIMADMPAKCMHVVWDTKEDTALLRIGADAVAVYEGDVSVFRYAPTQIQAGANAEPQENDWHTLQYSLFTTGEPNEHTWSPQAFTLRELHHHGELTRLTCRGAVLAGLGRQIKGD